MSFYVSCTYVCYASCLENCHFFSTVEVSTKSFNTINVATVCSYALSPKHVIVT